MSSYGSDESRASCFAALPGTAARRKQTEDATENVAHHFYIFDPQEGLKFIAAVTPPKSYVNMTVTVIYFGIRLVH